MTDTKKQDSSYGGHREAHRLRKIHTRQSEPKRCEESVWQPLYSIYVQCSLEVGHTGEHA